MWRGGFGQKMGRERWCGLMCEGRDLGDGREVRQGRSPKGCGEEGREECGVRGVGEVEEAYEVIDGRELSELWCAGRGKGEGDLERG